MFNNTIKLFRGEVSGDRAFRHVEEVVRHHRIQASPGYREAAEYCLKAFQKAGVMAEVESYPADLSSQHWSQLMFREWSCTKGELRLINPEEKLLASYDECKISLIQRSQSTPPGGVEAELVVLDKGDDKEPYREVDLTGKMVLTDGDLNKVQRWAIVERGAIGIISDRLAEIPVVRSRHDLPDARQYTSFWWTEENPVGFGFVLSPRLGDYLRKKAAEASREGKPVMLHAEVICSLYDGEIENVSALIPGDTDEEILVAAHLCHPQWSANDNASGVAVALETARTLQLLIDSGKLPKPKRGIRFLLIPEMTGTYAYLAHHSDRVPKTLAGLNLDMVGEKQELTKGPLVAEHPPQASDSFVGDLIEYILKSVSQEVTNFSGTASYGLFKHAATPFSGGSDHYILSDPTVNIPCPMLIQWPDKFYHTSEDTLDKVDPDMLGRVGVITATYAYALANADLDFAIWMLGQSSAQFRQQVSQYLQEQLGSISREIDAGRVRQQVEYWLTRRANQISSLERYFSLQNSEWDTLRLSSIAAMEDFVRSEWSRFEESARALGFKDVSQHDTATTVPGTEQVPTKKYPGPLAIRGHVDKLPAEERQRYEGLSKEFGADALKTTTAALYWADGKRTIAEVCKLVTLEMGHCNQQFMVRYMQHLAQMELIELR